MLAWGRACSSCAIAVRQSEASHSSGSIPTGMSAAFAIRPERTEPPTRVARRTRCGARETRPLRRHKPRATGEPRAGAGGWWSSRRGELVVGALLMLVFPLADRVAEHAEHVLTGVRRRLARAEAPHDLAAPGVDPDDLRSEEHTSELQSP